MTAQLFTADISLYSRQALPKEIAAKLLTPKRDQWEKHPQILMRSQIFFDYHQFLSGLSQQLAKTMEELLDYGNIHFINTTTALDLDKRLTHLHPRRRGYRTKWYTLTVVAVERRHLHRNQGNKNRTPRIHCVETEAKQH